jgi:hypothetical protein
MADGLCERPAAQVTHVCRERRVWHLRDGPNHGLVSRT